MTLSFREQAALIAFQVTANNSSIGKGVPPEVAIKGVSIAALQAAQIFADEACAVWKHNYVVRSEPGEITIVSNECQRCGAKK